MTGAATTNVFRYRTSRSPSAVWDRRPSVAGGPARPASAARLGVAECHRAEGNRQHAAGHHRDEDAVPAPVVRDPADAAAGDRRSEHVAEEAGEPGRGPGGL